MTFLPIVGRELRVAARRRGTYWVRFGVALAAILISGWMLLTLPSAGAGARPSGLGIFCVLASLGFVFCLTAGMGATADCLSAEKRDGTLGLLFLTDLRGYDVVLGKLAATSLGALYSLLTILPVIALPLLLGGVSPRAVALAGGALLNTLLFSLAAGMFVSALSRDERKAGTGAAALILLIAGILPLIGAILEESATWPWRRQWAWFLYLPSPGFAFVKALQLAGSPGVAGDYWWSLLTVHGEVWLFLGLACGLLPRTWSERALAAAKPGSGRARWQQWCYGNAVEKRRLRERLLEINPITWLCGRNRFLRAAPWLFLLFVALGWIAGYGRVRRDWLAAPVGITFVLLMHGVLKYHLAGEACRRLAEDRRSGALELLLSTPLSTREIVRGQWTALRRQFAGPFLAVLVIDGFLLLAARQETSLESQDANRLTLTFAAGMVVLVTDAFALSWLGMWCGLRAANYTRAWSQTMFWALALPWAIFLVTVITAGALELWRGPEGPGFGVLLAWWLFLNLGNDLILFGRAHAGLSSEFRAEAARRFQPGAEGGGWRFWKRR